MSRFLAVDFTSAMLRMALTCEGLFYLGTNARKKERYKTMAVEIVRMRTALTIKCPD